MQSIFSLFGHRCIINSTKYQNPDTPLQSLFWVISDLVVENIAVGNQETLQMSLNFDYATSIPSANNYSTYCFSNFHCAFCFYLLVDGFVGGGAFIVCGLWQV